MATTTRTDTSYSATLLRLHALEEYVKAEIAAIKDAIADLEPGGGGGSGDQDRIYNMTVKGAQVGMIDDVPQGPSIYDNFSLHQCVWGVHPDTHAALAAMYTEGGMKPLIEKIASPWQNPGGLAQLFWTSNESVMTLLVGNKPGSDEMYEAIVDAGSISNLAFGHEINAAAMVADGKNLYQMIQDLEWRVTWLESTAG